MVECNYDKNETLCLICKANHMENLIHCPRRKEALSGEKPHLLRVYIQTVIDSKPYYLRTEKVDISNYGVNFIGFDCNQIYLFDFNDVVRIVPDSKEEANI